MTTCIKAAVVLLGLVVAASCERTGSNPAPEPVASTPLSAEETELLHSLPSGSNLLIGGNFTRFQNYMQTSPFAKFAAGLDKNAPGLADWLACYSALPTKATMNSVRFTGSVIVMRSVMKGVDLAALKACADKAKFRTALDADARFLSLETPTPQGTITIGYLLLPNGALYSRQAFPFGKVTMPPPVDRAMLEADIGSLSSTAEKDTQLVAELGRLDRKRALWFAGSGAGTPLASSVGAFSGTLDIDKGLAVDVRVDFADAKLADRIEDRIARTQEQAKQASGTVGDFVARMKLTRNGKTLLLTAAATEQELAAMVEQMTPPAGK